jgi:hypothetical protein
MAKTPGVLRFPQDAIDIDIEAAGNAGVDRRTVVVRITDRLEAVGGVPEVTAIEQPGGVDRRVVIEFVCSTAARASRRASSPDSRASAIAPGSDRPMEILKVANR